MILLVLLIVSITFGSVIAGILRTDKLLDECLLEKSFRACSKLAEAHFIVIATAHRLGYEVEDAWDAYKFFIMLSCKYGDEFSCVEAGSYYIGYVDGFIYGLEKAGKAALSKDARISTKAIDIFKEAKYIHVLACGVSKLYSASFTIREEYRKACKGLYSSLQKLKNFMIQKLGFTEEEIRKIKIPDKFPLPDHMKHLSNYE